MQATILNPRCWRFLFGVALPVCGMIVFFGTLAPDRPTARRAEGKHHITCTAQLHQSLQVCDAQYAVLTPEHVKCAVAAFRAEELCVGAPTATEGGDPDTATPQGPPGPPTSCKQQSWRGAALCNDVYDATSPEWRDCMSDVVTIRRGCDKWGFDAPPTSQEQAAFARMVERMKAAVPLPGPE